VGAGLTAVCWLFNFDADDELAHGPGYTPRRSTRARIQELPALTGLVQDGDAIADVPLDPRWLGRAWCPTPNAIASLAALGVRVPAAPSLDTLARVNHRRFNAELGQTSPGAAFVTELAEIEAKPGTWLLKRAFSRAGSGQRRIDGALGAADRAWIARSLAWGGLQMEPWVEIVSEHALHGYLAADGTLTLGEPCRQEVDARGAWQRSLRDDKTLEPAEERALFTEAERAAAALAAAGYHGPFGVDAYRHRAGFVPRSEINARYTMGWAVGMGTRRPDRG
jgi:hypothetical protein